MKRLLKVLNRAGFDGFLLMIGTMILLAYFLLQPGMVKEPVSLEQIANAGVSLIFLFYGLRLSVEKLKAGLAAGMMVLFFAVFFCVGLLSRLFGFSDEDRITVLFCGSKKSLVHGTVMSKVLFQHSTITGIILPPA